MQEGGPVVRLVRENGLQNIDAIVFGRQDEQRLFFGRARGLFFFLLLLFFVFFFVFGACIPMDNASGALKVVTFRFATFI